MHCYVTNLTPCRVENALLRDQLNSTEISPPLKAASCSETLEIPRILCNRKLNYLLDKSPSLVHILSQMNLLHNTPFYLFKINFNIILSPLPSGLFPSGFPKNLVHTHILMPCPSHL
jgi:hypothetical protein